MKRKIKAMLIIMVVGVLLQVVFAEARTTTGTISKVVVYRGQALVTRSIELDLPAGSSEVIVTDLPAKILPESIYAETAGGTKVLSVRYLSRAVKGDTREEVRKLDSEIEEIKKQQYQAQRDEDIARWLFHKFEALWKWSVDATNVDLNRSIVESGPVENLANYLEGKNTLWHEKLVEIQILRKEFQKKLELLERKRKELSAGRSQTKREAVLYVTKQSNGKSIIELNYLVNGANWLPQYNLRGEPDSAKILIEYNAVINQTSGEDWDAAVVSLSTAEPAMAAAAPSLDPLQVTLGHYSLQSTIQNQQAEGQSPAQPFEQLYRQRLEASKKGKAAQRKLSQIAIDNQAMEFNVSRGQITRMNDFIRKVRRIEGVSVTYELEGVITLPSRNDQQLVSIAQIETEADFTFIATPLLTDYVYLQANVVNKSDTVFLPGQASVFRNGQFVGKSEMQGVTIGERFTAGFGIDSQIKVARELEDKRTRIQGGNRIDTFDYRIVLENYKDSPVKLQLVDRLPYTKNVSLKIEFVKTSPKLSTDKEYVRSTKKKGLLRWDLELSPSSIDDKAATVTYTYTMEYDRNMQISPLN